MNSGPGDSILEHACTTVRSHAEEDGFVGAFLYGSAARPYADERSDLDIQIVLTAPALARLPQSEHHLRLYGPHGKSADVWRITLEDLSLLTRGPGDVNRRRLSTSRVLFDSAGVVTAHLAEWSTISEDLRRTRLRVHWTEAGRVATTLEGLPRDASILDRRVFVSELAMELAKTAFFAKGAWPSPMTWMFDELRLAGVSTAVEQSLRAALDSPTVDNARLAVEVTRDSLDETYRDARAWLDGEDGRRAVLEWSGDAPSATLSPEEREGRLRTYYFEMSTGGQMMQKSEQRGKRTVLALLSGQILLSTAKLLAFERGRRLDDLGSVAEAIAPARILEAAHALASEPTARNYRALRARVDAHLVASGVAFVSDLPELWRWATHSDQGCRERFRWGGQLTRVA